MGDVKNLFGFSGANSLPKGVAGGAGAVGNDPIKIRQTTHFTSGGRNYRDLRERVKKIGEIDALVKGPDGKMIHKKIKDKVLFDQLKRAVKSGSLSTQWQRRIQKNKGFTSIDANGNAKTYIITGSKHNIDKRNALGKVFMPDGPSKREIMEDLKKQERFKRLNVLNVQWSQKKEDMASKLRNSRTGENALKNATVGKNNIKTNAADIGAKVIHSSAFALSGKTPVEKKSEMPDNVVPFRKNSEPNIPMQLTGTNN